MRNITPNSAVGRGPKSKHFRTFYVTILLLSSFAILGLITDWSKRYYYGGQYGVPERRALAELDAGRLLKRDEECRLVHHVKDKCAFIKTNCADEEAGLLSYLSLYYCSLPQTPAIAFIILGLWLALLFSTIGIAASEFFSINLSTISTIFGMSESMAGVTFLAFGNGSPDVFSTFAAMNSHSGSLAVGELIGAAGFITAVVAGSMALVREFKVGKKTFVRDVGFFIVASSFSLTFLADGALYFWECCVMIGYYLFYVATVVIWHWVHQRRRKQRERNALARSECIVPGDEDAEVQQADEEDDNTPLRERPAPTEGFNAVERGNSLGYDRGDNSDDESDEDGERSRLLAAEMANSMRVTRGPGSRRNTLNPIRPSLVGALEFRSVLSTLQKSRNIQSHPIHLRRYSDELTAMSDRQASRTAVTSDYDGGSIIITAPEDSDGMHQPGPSAPRTRAVSMNDAAEVRPQDAAAFSVANIPGIGLVAATPTFPRNLTVPGIGSATGLGSSLNGSAVSPNETLPHSPIVSISPPSSLIGLKDTGPPVPFSSGKDKERYIIPEYTDPSAQHSGDDYFQIRGHLKNSSLRSPRTQSPSRPRLFIPGSRDSSVGRSSPSHSPFPKYTDSPMPMSAQNSRPPSLHVRHDTYIPSESSYCVEGREGSSPGPKWWPYRLLPCPRAMLSTLLPTISSWRDKSILDKFLSIISAPSIFLLTITIPVVEVESKEQISLDAETEEPPQNSFPRRRSTLQRLTTGSPYQNRETEPEWLQYRRSTQEYRRNNRILGSYDSNGRSNSTELLVPRENQDINTNSSPNPAKQGEIVAERYGGKSAKDWNRWLLAVQIFTAPIFVMLIIWANTSDDVLDFRLLTRLILYSLLGSTVVFAVLLLTTTAEKPPKYRYLFCFLGFVASISWISTIANEVVGVLKAFSVILGMSDAILGLTVFAVGNSLGDLVADVTVARLGYPVMALSACFGGPMLNILLGIGISGLYMTIKEGKHKHAKHPDRPIKYRPYRVEVSGTLIVSGITLLVTLCGLLIAVPLNKWVMSRKIGIGLITLWSISTVVNIVIEITGIL